MEIPSILIVEEEAIIATDLSIKLEQMGFNVLETAFRLIDAIAIARRRCPQLAMLDINPARTGSEFYMAKTLQEMCNNLPVVFLSSDPGAMREIGRVDLPGLYDCIQKPFRKKDLVAKIGRVLRMDPGFGRI